jgi:hypothetical protein
MRTIVLYSYNNYYSINTYRTKNTIFIVKYKIC